MHPGQELVDRLHGATRPGFVAKLEHRLGDAVQKRPGGGKGIGRARGHDRQLPAGSLGRSARDRRIEIVDTACAAARRHVPGKGRGHSGTGQNHRSGLQPGHDAVLPEQHAFGLGGVQHDDGDCVQLFRGLGQGAALPPLCLEPCHLVGVDVSAPDLVPATQRRCGHSVSHRAQADDGDVLAFNSHVQSPLTHSGSHRATSGKNRTMASATTWIQMKGISARKISDRLMSLGATDFR